MRVLYSHGNASASARKTSRYIPQTPERILDAPDVINDYCKKLVSLNTLCCVSYVFLLLLDLNLIDWSCTNLLAVCLGSSLYIWNATTGSISLLLNVGPDVTLSSASWMGDGTYLTVGTSSGEVQVGVMFRALVLGCIFPVI